jgi:O-antigen biosynthesis protein
MKYTGERIIPGAVDDVLSITEHYSRYYFALQYLRSNHHVLDAACGAGYGSEILADIAENVIGGDVSEESIGYAKKTYARKNLHFQYTDVRKLSFEDNKFDVYTSFETIEHITEHENYLKEAVRVLKPDGLFIVSTPNKILYNQGRPPNEFHVKELTSVEFQILLGGYFKNITFYGQRYNFHLAKSHQIHSYFRRIKRALKFQFKSVEPFNHMEAMEIRPDQAHLSTYVIAVCSNH